MKKIKGFISLLTFFLLTINANIFAVTASGGGESGHSSVLPPTYMVLPFVLLLLMIATGPLFYHHFWEKHYPKISVALGSVTALYYIIVLNDSISLVHTLTEYISFIALLASLFVASGGILIKVDRKSTPAFNTMFLLFGSIISNIIGTTGASMLLIRPFIKINKGRIKPYHIIFFIFSVSNIGGALTPIGDPPLFLGFLRGVSFFWVVQHVWSAWLFCLVLLLLVFYFIDRHNHTESTGTYSNQIEFRGLKNVIFLIIIVLSVFIDPVIFSWVPSLKPLPFGIREIIMFSVVYLSYRFADKKAHEGNDFNFEPIKEVAYLFVGIFATMVPALQLIAHEANVLGDKLTPGLFYWSTGILSSFLDNAPTYLNFLSAALGKFGMDVNSPDQVHDFSFAYPIYLASISIAAVFFGAMTYIGNGPNFMVKSICEKAGIKMPSFFGYILKYSLPILLPIFFIIWYLFFHLNIHGIIH